MDMAACACGHSRRACTIFYAIRLGQPGRGVFSRRGRSTRPFVSELNAKPMLPGTLGTDHEPFRRMGEV